MELNVPIGDDVEYTVHCRATSLETGQDASAPPRHANSYQELLDAIKNHPNACVPDENYDRRLGIDVLTRTATGGWEVLTTVEGSDTDFSAPDEPAQQATETASPRDALTDEELEGLQAEMEDRVRRERDESFSRTWGLLLAETLTAFAAADARGEDTRDHEAAIRWLERELVEVRKPGEPPAE